MKSDLIISYSILALGVLGCVVSALWGISYNVDSIYDEGFLYFSQQSALNGHISGISQGVNIIAAFLEEKVCSSIFNLRIAAFVLKLACAVIFCFITSSLFGNGWKHNIGYFIMSLLMLTPHMSDLVLCQNGLAQFFFCIALALGVKVLLIDSVYNILWCCLLGICWTLGFFSILPGAVLLAGCLLLLFFTRFWAEWKKIIVYLLATISGIFISVLLIHLCVNDIHNVFDAMIETGKTVTTLNRGYDPLSFFINLLLFLRDWILCVMVIVGIMHVSERINSMGFKWFAQVFLVGMMLVYMYYQKKPMVTLSMFMSSIWVTQLYHNRKLMIHNKSILNFETALNIFLIFAPIILSIGTNTYLGGKMAFFMLPWTLLIYRLGWKSQSIPMRKEVCFVICILLIVPFAQFVKQTRVDSVQVEKGPLKGMHLTKQQAMHFIECERIVSDYNFQPKRSVIYSTQLGMMTTCYLNGINCANYFQPMDFVAHARQDNLPIPDFLFLCDYDITISGDAMREIGWGWPDDFDVYDVGTPETIDVGYPTTRKLYCRKSLRRQ